MNEKIRLIAIFGPTASGKTRLAAALGKHFGGEVVSADSMQIYSGMQIGTARPTEAEMDGVPHHLMGFLSPEQTFSVAQYVPLAKRTIGEIAARGKLPILAGGTGLYLSSVLQNLKFTETPTDPALRASLQKRAGEEGADTLYRELEAIDPQYAANVHPNNVKRVIRALELYYSAGVTMTQQYESSRRESDYSACKLAIVFRDREALYRRIDQRVEQMFEDGLLEEAKTVLSGPCRGTAIQAIGYKELLPYFNGEISLTEAKENIQRETRRYAKRQLTWIRREEDLHGLSADGGDFDRLLSEAIDTVNSFFDKEVQP